MKSILHYSLKNEIRILAIMLWLIIVSAVDNPISSYSIGGVYMIYFICINRHDLLLKEI